MQEKEKICLYCQEAFIPKRSDAQYCSSSCKQLAYLNRKNEEGNTGEESIELQEEELPVKTAVKTPVNVSIKPASIADNKPHVNKKEHPVQEEKEADEESEGPKTKEEYEEW